MNIFYLHRDPVIAAQWHCDKHVIKMPIEAAQMLSTAHHVLDKGREHPELYKSSHANHPCTVWVRSGPHQYLWAYELLKALCLEYRNRYGVAGKVHGVEKLLSSLSKFPRNIPWEAPFTPPPQCVPEDCLCSSTERAYQLYYIRHKAYFAAWKSGRIPSWFKRAV